MVEGKMWHTNDKRGKKIEIRYEMSYGNLGKNRIKKLGWNNFLR